ncbi:MAG: type II secretion system protein GspD [Burkholderiales bacterium]
MGDFLRLDVGGVQVIASLVNTDSRFTLVSSPKLRVKSGARARVQVGADVPTLGAITRQNGVSTQSVAYQKTGVTLDVLPTILHEVVSLDVRQSITEAQSTTTGVNNSPTLTTREVSSQLVMRSGESVVLAGLQSTRDNRSRSGLPFVPSWLHSKADDAQRTELVVFLSVSKP